MDIGERHNARAVIPDGGAHHRAVSPEGGSAYSDNARGRIFYCTTSTSIVGNSAITCRECPIILEHTRFDG
jgi:hypothetical protein